MKKLALLSASVKERIKRRRGYICNACGKKKLSRNLEIHHKDRNRHNNDPSNLRVLCIACHDALHRRAGY